MQRNLKVGDTRQNPNVVLLVLDTIRARELPIYGYDRETAPSLSRFASNATIYDRAYTNAPWTLPAHASLFSGLLPSEHGCHGGSPSFDLDATHTLAGQFRTRGYETYGVSNNVWVNDHFGMDAGFGSFHKEWQLFTQSRDVGHLMKRSKSGPLRLLKSVLSGNPLVNAVNGLYGKYFYRRDDFGAERTTSHVESILKDTDEPFFLFVNYMEAHAPYTPHEETEQFLPVGTDYHAIERLEEISSRSKDFHVGDLELDDDDFTALQAMYDGEIRYLDDRLGRLFDVIEGTDLRDTVVVVVGDHGENIGDHSLMAHRFSVHDTLVHVPLMIRYPDWFDAPDRLSVPVDFRDLFAELVAIADGADSTRMPVKGRDEPVVTEYLDTTYTPEAKDDNVKFEGSEYDHRLAAAITEKYKYVLRDDDQERLYRYGARDFEIEGRLVEEESVTTELREYCSAVRQPDGDEGEEIEDESVRSHLEELGYL